MLRKFIKIFVGADLAFLAIFNSVFQIAWQFLFIMVAFVILVLFLVALSSEKEVLSVSFEELFLALSLIVLSLFSYYKFISFVETCILISGIIFYIVISEFFSEFEKQRVLFFIFILGLFESLSAFAEYVICALFPQSTLAKYFILHSFVSFGRASSFFQYPNAFAGFLLMPFFISMYLLSVSKRNASRFFFVSASAFMLFVVYLTSSRGTYIVLVVSVLIIFFVEKKVKKRTLFLQVLSVFVISVLFYLLSYKIFYPSIKANFERTKVLIQFFAGETNRSLYDRIQLVKDSVRIFLHHPLFGTGLGTFKNAMLKYRVNLYFAKEPHSLPFRILAETGILGFIALFYFYYKKIIGSKKRNAFLFVSVLALLLHTFLDLDFAYPLISTLIFVGLAIINGKKDQKVFRIRPKILPYMTVVLIGFIIFVLVPNFLSGIYLNGGNAALRSGRMAEAISSYRLSLRLQPADASTHAQLAYAYEKQAYSRENNCKDYVDEAIKEYGKASDLDKLSFIYPLYEGDLRLLEKDPLSIGCFKKSLSLNPLWKPILSDIALSEAYIGENHKDSVKCACEALKFNAPKWAYKALGYDTSEEKDSNAYTALGFVFLNKNFFDKALLLNSRNGFAYLGKYFTEDDEVLKIEDLRKAIEVNPCIFQARKLYFTYAPLLKVKDVDIKEDRNVRIVVSISGNTSILKEIKVFVVTGNKTILVKSFGVTQRILNFKLPSGLGEFRIKIEAIDKNNFAVSGIISPEFGGK